MVSIWNRFWWGGDPDERSDISGLSRRDVHYISRSWALMNNHAVKYGMEIFLRLFRIDPPTKSFFKQLQHMNEEEISSSVQFKAHVVNLMSAFNSAVCNLHQPEVVVAMMNKIGQSHHQRRVLRIHFDEVKTILVEILREELNADEATIASWGRFIDFIYSHIFDKLRDA